MPKTRSKRTPTKSPNTTTVYREENRALRRTIGTLSQKLSKLEEVVNQLNSQREFPEQGPARVVREEPTLSSSENNFEGIVEDNIEQRPQMQMSVKTPQEGFCYVNMAPPIHIEKPRFPGKNQIHPVTFIEDLTSWLRKMPSRESEVELIMECLDGTSRDWARIYKERWGNLSDFKRDFLNTYWGEAEQSDLRRRIVVSQWDRAEQPTMLGHFITLSGQAKMLNYPIPENQLINDIMSHFPKDVQYAWANQSSNLLVAAEFLRKLDAINRKTVLGSGRESTVQKGKVGNSQFVSGNQTGRRNSGTMRKANTQKFGDSGRSPVINILEKPNDSVETVVEPESSGEQLMHLN